MTDTEIPNPSKAREASKLAIFGVCALAVMMGLSLVAAKAYQSNDRDRANVYVECLAEGRSGCVR
jgi:hypothetical protein